MPRSLRPVPDAPPRAVAYVRVSKDKDDGISPELQLSAIEEHCARAGYMLVETITDLDLSGRFWRRRQVERAVAMIERGDADVLVVWKWSRVARNRLDWAVAVDRVESAGGKLDSATEPLDASTSTGRFARGMLAEFAAFESDRIGDVWREVHARRTARGLPTTGKPRFGYEHVDGIHRPHPKYGPVLAEAYRRYLDGESMLTIAEWLTAEGIPSNGAYVGRPGGPWSHQVVRRMLDTGFAAGYITVHGERRRGVHEPLIDEATWRAYLAARQKRAATKRSENSPLVLSGLLRCSCGAAVASAGKTSPRVAYYRCSRDVRGGGRHEYRYFRADVVERAVLDWLREIADDATAAADAAVAQRAKAARRREDARVLRRELLASERALARLAVDQAKDRTMPASVWSRARDQLLLEREQLQQRLVQAEAESTAGPVARRVAADLLRRWDIYPVQHRRKLLRDLIRVVTVSRDAAGARIDVTPTWA